MRERRLDYRRVGLQTCWITDVLDYRCVGLERFYCTIIDDRLL